MGGSEKNLVKESKLWLRTSSRDVSENTVQAVQNSADVATLSLNDIDGLCHYPSPHNSAACSQDGEHFAKCAVFVQQFPKALHQRFQAYLRHIR